MSTTSGIDNTYTNPDLYQVGDNKPSSSLDKNGFLKMLTEQIKNQDPTSGQDPNQYFQTISQMTSVEQLTNLAMQTTKSSTQALIGRTVTYPGTNREMVTGLVESIQLGGSDGPTLTVAGKPGIKPDSLTNVQ
jgi:flagellar basal-body rod modification protein FlgD